MKITYGSSGVEVVTTAKSVVRLSTLIVDFKKVSIANVRGF